MDRFEIWIRLCQDQETTMSLCSKQINQNHEREECRVPLYPYKRIQQTYRVGDYPVTTWKGAAYGRKGQNGWNLIKYQGQYEKCQRLTKKHSRIYNQKSEDQKLSKKHQLLLKESKSFQKLQTKQLRPK